MFLNSEELMVWFPRDLSDIKQWYSFPNVDKPLVFESLNSHHILFVETFASDVIDKTQTNVLTIQISIHLLQMNRFIIFSVFGI